MTYPIIIIEESDNQIFGFINEKGFTITTREGLNNEVYNSGLIIDSDGKSWSLVGADEVGWGNSFFGINFLVRGRLIKVKPKVIFKQNLSLSEIKEIVIGSLNRNKQLWDDYGGVDEYLELLQSAGTIRDVVKVFAH